MSLVYDRSEMQEKSTFEPSSGGMGMILKIASAMLRYAVIYSISSSQFSERPGRWSRANKNPYRKRNTRAISRFAIGPAAAVMAMPFFGFLNFHMFTGTGFAQPNLKTIIMSRPMMSMCRSGLSVRRPARLAVSSPRR